MNSELFISISGAIVSILGGIRWLLQVYFKQQKEINKLKRNMYIASMDEIKTIIDDFNLELSNFKDDLQRITEIGTSAKTTGLKVMRYLESYINQNEKRLKSIENEIETLSSFRKQ